MEYTMNNGFSELNNDEAITVDGGRIPKSGAKKVAAVVGSNLIILSYVINF
jgi:hypothetical protein